MINDLLFRPYITFEEPDESGGGSADEPEEESGEATSFESLEEAEKEIKSLRKEAAKYRTRSKDTTKDLETFKSKYEKLEKGLKSIFGDGEEVDPDKLKQRTQSLENELKTERVKNAVTVQAIQQGLDPELTIAYLQNQGSLADLDTSDSESIEKALSSAVDKKPNLKVSKPDSVGSGGGGNSGSEADKKLNPIDAYRQKRGLLQNSK